MKVWQRSVCVLSALLAFVGIAAYVVIRYEVNKELRLTPREEEALLEAVDATIDWGPESLKQEERAFILLTTTSPDLEDKVDWGMQNSDRWTWLKRVFGLDRQPRKIIGTGRFPAFEYETLEEVRAIIPEYRGDWSTWQKRFPDAVGRVCVDRFEHTRTDQVVVRFSFARLGDGYEAICACTKTSAGWKVDVVSKSWWAI